MTTHRIRAAFGGILIGSLAACGQQEPDYVDLAAGEPGYRISREPAKPFENVVTDTEQRPYSRNNPEAVFDERMPLKDIGDTPDGAGASASQAMSGPNDSVEVFDADPAFPISRGEAAFSPVLDRTFRLLDSNGDGMLTAAEFGALNESLPRAPDEPQ